MHVHPTMATFSEKIPMPASVLVLEMLAAHRAVQFVLELGFRHSSFEGDSKDSGEGH